MTATTRRTYVGFGFGPIQAGLFVFEAQRSAAFGRLVIAEVLPDVVQAVRAGGGRFGLNVAHHDHVESCHVGPVEMFDPAVPADREALVEAIASAEELATAVPGVDYYKTPGPASLQDLLADGLRQKLRLDGPHAVIYAAENHNHAAEILRERVSTALPPEERSPALSRVRFVNTVIGKMSGTVDLAAGLDGKGEVEETLLLPVTPDSATAFLVESFNRILISRIAFEDAEPFRRGLAVFEEKNDLLPFEEAKLYGHNAVHAVAGYVGAMCGARCIADLPGVPGMVPFLRSAFVDESGAALVRKHQGVDPLFTASGYAAYADDLLERMVNPHLRDTVERVGRQVERKLGWDDRLVGTMRLALGQGVEPRRFALGAAAALVRLDAAVLDCEEAGTRLLERIWGCEAAPQTEKTTVLSRIRMATAQLRRWRQAGAPPLEEFLAATD